MIVAVPALSPYTFAVVVEIAATVATELSLVVQMTELLLPGSPWPPGPCCPAEDVLTVAVNVAFSPTFRV